jgi:hypothetical protein
MGAALPADTDANCFALRIHFSILTAVRDFLQRVRLPENHRDRSMLAGSPPNLPEGEEF